MSISTKRGETGQTGLASGIRVSKSSTHVEACGTVDELNASSGFARSLSAAIPQFDEIEGHWSRLSHYYQPKEKFFLNEPIPKNIEITASLPLAGEEE